jgi:hypothetical protein
MPTPAYSSAGFRRGWGHSRHWGHAPESTDNGWFDRVRSWLGGNAPQYVGVGQPAPRTDGSGTPVYLPAPSKPATADVVATTPQAISPVIVVPRT